MKTAEFLALCALPSLCVCTAAGAEPGSRLSADTAPGLFANSHLDISFRNYAETLQIANVGSRHAWIQSQQMNFESGFTGGVVGLGFDASGFLSAKLDGGVGAGNMVLSQADGGPHRTAWATLGRYTLKARHRGITLKYGLQSVVNPFLAPYDNRALPPTFRGLSVVTESFHGASFDIGSFDATLARGRTSAQPLSTAYGQVPMKALHYVGANLLFGDATMSLYASRAQDLWNQFYGSAARSVKFGQVRWRLAAAGYYTQGQGEQRQGAIDNKALSGSVAAQLGASTVMLGYQRIFGENFFDFAAEANGMYLANSMSLDHNAPGEQSVQLQYRFDGAQAHMPGALATMWAIDSWGSRAPAWAREYFAGGGPMSQLYWLRGAPIGGGDAEIGVKLAYTLQLGALKGGTITSKVVLHDVGPAYPSKRFRDFKMTVEYPLTVF